MLAEAREHQLMEPLFSLSLQADSDCESDILVGAGTWISTRLLTLLPLGFPTPF